MISRLQLQLQLAFLSISLIGPVSYVTLPNWGFDVYSRFYQLPVTHT